MLEARFALDVELEKRRFFSLAEVQLDRPVDDFLDNALKLKGDSLAVLEKQIRLHLAERKASANGMKDYTGERTIQIGWIGARVQAEECESLAVYKDSAHIKDMNREEARKWLGIETPTVPVNPNPAPTAEGAIWIA